MAGGYGIAVFLLMNVLIYGDPLAFLSTYTESNGPQAFASESRTRGVGEPQPAARLPRTPRG